MEWVVIVIALALLQYSWFGIEVGRARAKYGCPAPAMTGHEVFERHLRVHQNTLEQLVVLVPAILLFARYHSGLAAAALGLLFIAGRFVYRVGYVRDPGKRGAGFMIGWLAMAALLFGGLAGAVGRLL